MASSPHHPNHKAKYPLQPKYPGPDLLLPSKIGTHAGPGKDLLIQTHVFVQTSIATSSKLSSQIWPPDETPNTPSCCHQAQSTLGSHNTTRQKKRLRHCLLSIKHCIVIITHHQAAINRSLDSTSWIHWQLWFSQPFVAAFIPLSPWAASSLKSHQNCVIRLAHLLCYVIL